MLDLLPHAACDLHAAGAALRAAGQGSDGQPAGPLAETVVYGKMLGLDGCPRGLDLRLKPGNLLYEPAALLREGAVAVGLGGKRRVMARLRLLDIRLARLDLQHCLDDRFFHFGMAAAQFSGLTLHVRQLAGVVDLARVQPLLDAVGFLPKLLSLQLKIREAGAPGAQVSHSPLQACLCAAHGLILAEQTVDLGKPLAGGVELAVERLELIQCGGLFHRGLSCRRLDGKCVVCLILRWRGFD